MEFVIDRSKWRSGGDGENQIGRGSTLLYNNQGFMCCLGQTCNQIGVKVKDMRGLGEPGEISGNDYKDLPEIFFNVEVEEDIWDDGEEEVFLNDTDLSAEAISINDNEEMGQRERERRLRELFAKHGHKLKFKGKAVKK